MTSPQTEIKTSMEIVKTEMLHHKTNVWMAKTPEKKWINLDSHHSEMEQLFKELRTELDVCKTFCLKQDYVHIEYSEIKMRLEKVIEKYLAKQGHSDSLLSCGKKEGEK